MGPLLFLEQAVAAGKVDDGGGGLAVVGAGGDPTEQEDPVIVGAGRPFAVDQLHDGGAS